MCRKIRLDCLRGRKNRDKFFFTKIVLRCSLKRKGCAWKVSILSSFLWAFVSLFCFLREDFLQDSTQFLKTFYKVAFEFFEFHNLFNFSKNFQILCKIEKIEKKILGNCSIERIRIMSGSCHLDRASSVKIGVECQIFVNVFFFKWSDFAAFSLFS